MQLEGVVIKELCEFFEIVGGSLWNQKGTDIVGEATGDECGFSVSLSKDGSVVAVSSPQYNHTLLTTNKGNVI